MRHNAHYTSEFNGINIPSTLSIYDKLTGELLMDFSAGDNFGDFICALYDFLKQTTCSVMYNGNEITVYAAPVRNKEFSRFCGALHDFIYATGSLSLEN